MLSISYKKSKCKFFSFVHFIQCCSMEAWKWEGFNLGIEMLFVSSLDTGVVVVS